MSDPGVLVVGAGPTGLTLACELLRLGCPCRIVDRDPGPHTESRATDVHPHTLEAFQHMGILGEVLGRGQVRRQVGIFSDGARVAQVALEDADTPFAYMLGIAQCDSEAVLEARLQALGGKVERGTRLATLTQDPEGVSATLLRADGRWEEPRF